MKANTEIITDSKIDELKAIVEEQMIHCPGHKFDHVMRVYNNALKIAENISKNQTIDLNVIKVAIIFHDIAQETEINDSTGDVDHAVEGAIVARKILSELDYKEDFIQHVSACIESHRYRNKKIPETIEAKIIFDADKLDTVGAIGIARGFSWVGKNNCVIYKKVDIDEYAKENLGGDIRGRIKDKSKHSFQICWETKDQFILDYMYTDEAKEIAKERRDFSKMFLDRLENEINGNL